MKIRNGFVSNSSSSSFLIIGHKLDFDTVKYDGSKNYICVGNYLCEGSDIFEVESQEELDFLNEIRNIYSYPQGEIELYESLINDSNSAWSGKINIDLPKGEYDYSMLDRDYNWSIDLEQLFERYDPENKSKVRIKWERKIKLNELENNSGL